MAAPTLNGEVLHDANAALASSATFTLTLTSDVVGNCLVMGFIGPNVSMTSITDSRGNTWSALGGTNSGTSRLTAAVGRMDRPLKAGEKLFVTMASAITRYAVVILDYSNANLTGVAVDAGLASASGTSTAPLSTATGATTVNDEIVIGFTLWASATTADFSAAGAGFTQRGTKVTDGTSGLAVEDKTISATGTQTSNATLGTSLSWVQSTIAIRGSQRFYVDYSKADNTGAGTSWATAKKDLSSITPKSGDTITMAKSPDPSALTGTMTFTDNSTSVSTSADLSATLAAKDMIGPYTGSNELTGDGWWEVSSVTSSTITLALAYCGTTRSSVTGYRSNGFDAGSPATAATTIIAAGNVAATLASPITATGGYDTGLDSRTGMTHLRVSGATKNGIAQLSGIPVGWIMQYVGISRGSKGADINGQYQMFQNCFAAACSVAGYQTSAGKQITFDTCYVFQTTSAATAAFVIQHDLTYLVNCVVQGTASTVYGYYFTSAGNMTLESCTARRTANPGVFLNGGRYVRINNATVNNCSNGVSYGGSTSVECMVAGGTWASNSTDFNASALSGSQTLYIYNASTSSTSSYNRSNGGMIRVDRHNQTAGSHRSLLQDGTIITNTANARSDTCLELQPFANNGAVAEVFLPISVESSSTRVVTCYLSVSSSWNGTKLRLGLRQYGAWVQPTTTLPNQRDGEPLWPVGSGAPGIGSSYTQYSFSFAMSEIGSIDLCLQADGTAGSIYLDDVSWS